MHDDISPCLKTGLRYLFILSTGDVNKEDSEREFCRWMLPYERPALQGCEPHMSTTLRANDLIHACGNAFPVNLIAACVIPMLHVLQKSNCLKSSRTAPKTKQLHPEEHEPEALGLPDCYGFFVKMLGLKKQDVKRTFAARSRKSAMKSSPKAMKSSPKKKAMKMKKPASKRGGKGKKSSKKEPKQASLESYGVVLTKSKKRSRDNDSNSE